MSEQVITDTDAQQTDVRGFLRKMTKGEPINTEATSQLLNRIFNILEGIAGEGCVVEKPLDKEGLGWKVVIDGSHSDLEPMGRVPMPFEFIAVDNAWHIWLKDAEVVLNNFHATRASNLTLDASGCYSTATFGANSNVYLYVYQVADGDTMHSDRTYFFDVSTSVPTGALASILLGRVQSAYMAIQNNRGNQIFYTFADSEIIRHDATNAVVHVITDSTSGTLTFDDHLGLVLRQGGVIKYYKATDLLKAAYDKVKELMSEEPDPELDPSDVLPIGDETYEEWEWRIKEGILSCLIEDGCPYMPDFKYGNWLDPEHEEDETEYRYYGGYGAYDPVNDKFDSFWRGIDDSTLFQAHLPARTDLNEILQKIQEIKNRLSAIENDPDGPLGPQKNLYCQLGDKVDEVLSATVQMQGHLSSVQDEIDAVSANYQAVQSFVRDNDARYLALQDRQAQIDADVTDLENLPT